MQTLQFRGFVTLMVTLWIEPLVLTYAASVAILRWVRGEGRPCWRPVADSMLC